MGIRLWLLVFVFFATSAQAAAKRPQTANEVAAQTDSFFAIADFDGDKQLDIATVQVGQIDASDTQYWIHFRLSSGTRQWLFSALLKKTFLLRPSPHQLRASGHTIEAAAMQGAVLRLRPIMMTMLVATLGLLPAALSHGIGSDSQRPFAIVIVGGLVGALLLSIFLLPTLYVWVAKDGDKLPTPELEFDENA